MLEREELDNCENEEATLCPCDSLERIVCCAAAPFNAAAAVPFYSTELKKLLAFTLGLIVCESGRAHSPIFQVRYFRPSRVQYTSIRQGILRLAILRSAEHPKSSGVEAGEVVAGLRRLLQPASLLAARGCAPAFRGNLAQRQKFKIPKFTAGMVAAS